MALALAFYAEKDVVAMLGVSRTTVWRMCREKQFPAPVPISKGRGGYPRELVDQWISDKVAATGKAAA
jgi:predicted DNA-binding transcriptional regulator AlpA